jgi:hypothetical protein
MRKGRRERKKGKERERKGKKERKNFEEWKHCTKDHFYFHMSFAHQFCFYIEKGKEEKKGKKGKKEEKGKKGKKGKERKGKKERERKKGKEGKGKKERALHRGPLLKSGSTAQRTTFISTYLLPSVLFYIYKNTLKQEKGKNKVRKRGKKGKERERR